MLSDVPSSDEFLQIFLLLVIFAPFIAIMYLSYSELNVDAEEDEKIKQMWR